MDKPKVTIGMPVYNGARTLGKTIDSLLAQTFTDFELLISDNASTDDTGEICKQYENNDTRLKYYRNDNNIGGLANFNRLVGLGSGSLFVWAACDDLWEPEYISELVHLLESNRDAVLAFCQVDYIDLSSNRTYPGKSSLSLSRSGNTFRRLARFLLFPEVESKASMIYGVMRKSVLEGIGGLYTGFHQDKVFGHDNQTLFLMAMQGRFAISDKRLFHKCGQIGCQLDKKVAKYTEIRQDYQAYRKHIGNSGLGTLERYSLRLILLLFVARRVLRVTIGKIIVKARIPLLEHFFTKALLKMQSLYNRKQIKQ